MTKPISVILLVCFILVYQSCTIQEQIVEVKAIFSPSLSGDVKETINRMDSVDRFRNILLNAKYKQRKKQYYARFVDGDEVMKYKSGNEVIDSISRIYQNYWSVKIMKNDVEFDADSVLYSNISHYLVENKLTEFTYDTLFTNARDDNELGIVIEKEGFYSKFLWLNGMQDLIIWKSQKEDKYKIDLPKDTIDINVVFISDYVLYSSGSYALFENGFIGGWASKGSSSLYCNKESYKLTSEIFKISYLKHEANHFVDLKKYTNLSSADLEYRSKLIELSYATKKTIFDIIDSFIRGADKSERTYSHPYGNYFVIQHLSKAIFKSDFESDIKKWKMVSVEVINKASLRLFEENTKFLDGNVLVSKVI